MVEHHVAERERVDLFIERCLFAELDATQAVLHVKQWGVN
jgi:hypothetical protein